MSTPALRPLGIGEILDVSLKIAWRNLGTLVRIVLLVVAPAQVLIAIVTVSAIPDYTPQVGAFPTAEGTIEPDEAWTFAAAATATLLISFLAGQFATGACFRAVAETYLGRQTTWRASLGFAARRFLSILWIVVLGGFLTVIGAIFCLIPGIYLWVVFAVALPVLMSEGQRGRHALGRSRALIKGRWWKTALALVVAGLLAWLVSTLVSGAVIAVSFVGDDPILIFVVTAVAGTAGALVSTPFSAAYHTVLYFDLRVRKEAFDLQLLSSRLGVEAPAGWVPPQAPPSPVARPPIWPPPPGWQPPAELPQAEPEPPQAEAPPPQPPAEPPPAEAEPQRPPIWPPPPGWKAPEE